MNKNCINISKASIVLVWFWLNNDFAPKILLTRRSLSSKRYPGYYGATGGMVEKDECIICAANRELKEETGLTVFPNALRLLDCLNVDSLKAFIFEINLPFYKISEIKNTEPTKHSPWKLYDIDEALKLPKLMPNLKKILLTNQKKFSKLKNFKN